MDTILITIGNLVSAHRRGPRAVAGLLAVAAAVSACTGGGTPFTSAAIGYVYLASYWRQRGLMSSTCVYARARSSCLYQLP